MSPHRNYTALACLLALLATAGCSRQAPAPSVPAHLDIQIARIREGAPIDHRSAATRPVTLSLEIAGPPVCSQAQPNLIYGFLIDSDRDAQTGSTDTAFLRLGIDARISAECDPSTGQFTSRVGAVELSVNPDTGATIIEIHSLVENLPSVDFYWIAFAHDDPMFIRAPEAPGFMTWAILERSTYGLAVLSLLAEAGDEIAKLKAEIGKRLAAGELPDQNVRDRAAIEIRARAATLYRNGHWGSSIDGGIAQADHAKLKPLLEELADLISPDTAGQAAR